MTVGVGVTVEGVDVAVGCFDVVVGEGFVGWAVATAVFVEFVALYLA